MTMPQDTDPELSRVLSNPDNLIISESLLERLPTKKEPLLQRCSLKINDALYSGFCLQINFQKDKAKISIELESNEPKFKFIDSNFPNSLFQHRVSITLDEEEKIITGKLLEVSYDLSLSSKCIMSLEIYNYQLEGHHG